jgi:hypothetical protein
MANGIRVDISWPTNLGHPGFARGGDAPMNPTIEQLLKVTLYKLEHPVAPGGQEPGKITVYETLPVELPSQLSWQMQPHTIAGGIHTETIMVSAASLPSTVALTVRLRDGAVWVGDSGLPSGFRIRFVAPANQRLAGSASEEFAVVSVTSSATPMGQVAFNGEARP